MTHRDRTDQSRRLVASLVSLLDQSPEAAADAMSSEERAALFAAARDYAQLEPEACTRCGMAVAWLDPRDPSEYSYDRALRIHASGGYGMFIDPFMEGNPDILLCHACAHAVCAALPWLATAIGATTGHSHDSGEVAGWPTIEEAAAILDRSAESLADYVEPTSVVFEGVVRIRPANIIEIARAIDQHHRLGEIAAAVISIAGERAPDHLEAISAEIEACFLLPQGPRVAPEDAPHFLAAVRRLSPVWADRLDAIYGISSVTAEDPEA